VHKDGHVGVALLLYAPVVAAMSYRAEWLLPYAALGAVALVDIMWPVALLTDSDVSFSFAMIPDLDMRVSFVKHRGITHTVWFALFTGAVTAALTYGLVWYGADRFPQYVPEGTLLLGSLFMGGIGVFSVLTHLLGDVMTPMGIEPFAPLSDRRYTLDLWRADNSVANAGLHALGVVVVLFAFVADEYVTLPSLPV
jgi:inner membrane protein